MTATEPAPRTSRRGFLKIVALSSLAAGLGVVATRHRLAGARLPVSRTTRLLMGTVVHLSVAGPDAAGAEAAVAATVAEMERLIALLDHRRPASALGRLNATGAGGGTIEADCGTCEPAPSGSARCAAMR